MNEALTEIQKKDLYSHLIHQLKAFDEEHGINFTAEQADLAIQEFCKFFHEFLEALQEEQPESFK